MHDGKSFGKIKVVKNNTSAIDDFVAWISSLEGKKLLFRGHADSTWKVEASGYRRLGKNATPATFHNSTKRLIDNARLRGLDKKDGMKMPDLELLAELQHYGAATCLIDFTENPYTALWFACHEHQDRDGAVVAMASDDSEKFSEITGDNKGEKITKFLQQEKIWKWTPPHAQNNRIVAQSSIFLFGPSRISAKLYKKEIIKKSDKKDIIAYLRDKFSITEQRLFSDFAGFAMANAHNKEYTNYSAGDYFSLGVTHHQRGEYKEAIEYYGQAIAINPKLATAYNNRGDAKNNLSNYKEAIADFDKAIEINPQHAKAYNNRGIVKAKLGNHKEAIQDFDKAIEASPQLAGAYYNRGIAKAELGSHKEAIQDFDKAIEINPQYAKAFNNRGNVKADSGNPKEAIQDFDKAIEINPQYAKTFNNRGIVKQRIGDQAGAKEDFATSAKLKKLQNGNNNPPSTPAK